MAFNARELAYKITVSKLTSSLLELQRDVQITRTWNNEKIKIKVFFFKQTLVISSPISSNKPTFCILNRPPLHWLHFCRFVYFPYHGDYESILLFCLLIYKLTLQSRAATLTTDNLFGRKTFLCVCDVFLGNDETISLSYIPVV